MQPKEAMVNTPVLGRGVDCAGGRQAPKQETQPKQAAAETDSWDRMSGLPRTNRAKAGNGEHTCLGPRGGLRGRLHEHGHVAAAGRKQSQHVIEPRVGPQLRSRAHLQLSHARASLLVHKYQLLHQDDAYQLLPAGQQGREGFTNFTGELQENGDAEDAIS